MKQSLTLGLAFALTLLVGASSVVAQDAQEPPVAVRVAWNVNALPAGGSAVLGVLFDVPKGYHITDKEYGLFFAQVFDTLGLHFGDPEFPASVPFQKERCYRGRNLIRVPVTVADTAASGDYALPVLVGYQICQEFGQETCFLPNERDITLAVKIVPSGTPVLAANADVFAAPPPAPERLSLEQRLMAALEKGSWLAFVLVFLGGILTSFTPCVYPVIPITIGYIGGASKGKPWRGLRLSALFALGIAIVYSSLGLLAAATGTLFGAVSGSPIVNIIVAVVFAVMGFSMLGAFDITLPSALQSSLSGGATRRGFLGPLLLGMASGLVMAPCVGPVIVALLAWVSKTGSLLYGWALLFVFSMGLGLLFLVIGTFAGAIQALPKAGAWMDAIKKGFGWILLAAALYLLRLTIPEPYYSLAWAVLLIVFAVFSGAFEALLETAGSGRKLWKAATLIAFLVGAALLFRAIVPSAERAVGPSEAGVTWLVNEEEAARRTAAEENRPLIVDVYADWCVACVELDHKTWNKPEVASRLGGFVRLKLDFTRETPWVSEMKSKYEITGMPTVMMFDPMGREVARFTGFKSGADFLALLDQHGL